MNRLLCVFILATFAGRADAVTLYVCAAGGDDSRSYATAQNVGTPWATIGRAAWGSTNRSAPNTSAAAQAGDTVVVCAGTYEYTGTVDDRSVPVYNPANEGTAGNYITFQASGDVVLSAPSANSPVIGAYQRDYIKWYADIAQGHSWVITCDGRGGVTADTKSGTVVNTRPDTGPVVAWASAGTWLEGLVIDGGPAVDYNDNYDGIRVEESADVTVRNNTIEGFRIDGNGANGKGIDLYASPRAVIEHNVITDAGSGIGLKYDAAGLNEDIVIRWNVTRTDRGLMVTHSDGGLRVYGNWFLAPSGVSAQSFGLFVTSGGLQDDWIFNNIFLGHSDAAWYLNQTPTGARLWNNLVIDSTVVLYLSGRTMPAATSLSVEHNHYHGYTTFYTGSDGSRTLASFESAYTDQHAAAPDAIDAEPRFVDEAGEDFRLCTGSGTPDAGCTVSSGSNDLGVDIGDLDGDASTSDNVDAGPYVLGTETVGLDYATATAPDAPTIGSAFGGNARCTITFTANRDGGSPITGYTATSSPGSITGTGSSSPITVTGLTNGTAYTFTVTATNAEGTSSASSASNSCTPTAPATQGIRINIRGTGEQDQAGAWRFHLDQVLEDPRGVPFPAR